MPEYFKESTPEEVFGLISSKEDPFSDPPYTAAVNTSANTGQQPQTSPLARREARLKAREIRKHQQRQDEQRRTMTRRLFLTSAIGAVAAIGGSFFLNGTHLPSLPLLPALTSSQEEPTPAAKSETYTGDRLSEQQKWEETLGVKIHVDPLPSFLKPEVIEKLRRYGLHLRYMPQLRYKDGIQVRAAPIDGTSTSSATPNWQPADRPIKTSRQFKFEHINIKFWEEMNKGNIPMPNHPGQWSAVEVMAQPEQNKNYARSPFNIIHDINYRFVQLESQRILSFPKINIILNEYKETISKDIGLDGTNSADLRVIDAFEWNFFGNRERWVVSNQGTPEITSTKFKQDEIVIMRTLSSFQTSKTTESSGSYRIGMFFPR